MAVLNKYKDHIPFDSVYIGRGSIWGNPFPMSKDCPREECLVKYNAWVKEQIRLGYYTLEQLSSLHQRDLVCYCAPKACHGHTLEKLAYWAYEKLHQN